MLRYAHATQADVETPVTSRRSPSAVPTTRRTTPPVSICTAASANGLGGTGSRVVAKVPVAQPRLASSTSHGPHHVVPCTPPEAGPANTSTASPTTPTPTPAIVAVRGRSPVSARKSTIHSGTAAISSAASPDDTPCWATTTMPLPHAGSRRPESAVVPNCAGVHRNAAPPGDAEHDHGQQHAADQEPEPAHEQRWHGREHEAVGQVGRAPQDVHHPEGDPGQPGRRSSPRQRCHGQRILSPGMRYP